MKLPKGWGVPARLVLVVILELGLRNHAADSGLGAVLLSPSGQGSDFPLFLALLLLLVRLTAIWIVLPLTVAWGMITLWSRWHARSRRIPKEQLTDSGALREPRGKVLTG